MGESGWLMKGQGQVRGVYLHKLCESLLQHYNLHSQSQTAGF